MKFDYSDLRWIRDGFDSNPNWTTSTFADGFVALSCLVYRREKDNPVYSAVISGKTARVKCEVIVELDAYATVSPVPPREWKDKITEGMEKCLEETKKQHAGAELRYATAPRCNRKCRWWGGKWCMKGTSLAPTRPTFRCVDYEEKTKKKSLTRRKA